MRRREFVATVGIVAGSGTGVLAGCAGDGGSDMLSVTSVDGTSVDEPRTILVEVTVENDGSDRRSGVLVGEVEVEDDPFTGRRQVTVDGGEALETAVKVDYESDSSVVTYTSTANIEDEESGDPADPIATDPAEDLVVTDVDHESTDADRTIAVTAQVRNLVDEVREATLVGEVDLEDGGSFTERRTVRVDGGSVETLSLRVTYQSDQAFVTYTASADLE